MEVKFRSGLVRNGQTKGDFNGHLQTRQSTIQEKITNYALCNLLLNNIIYRIDPLEIFLAFLFS